MGLFPGGPLGMGVSPLPHLTPRSTMRTGHLHIQTWDSLDFFTVSLTITSLSEEFGRSKTDITWGITLVLMFRSVGAVLFGIAADRYGRKWPFVVNNILFIVLELVSSQSLFPCYWLYAIFLIFLFFYIYLYLFVSFYTLFPAPDGRRHRPSFPPSWPPHPAPSPHHPALPRPGPRIQGPK